MNKTILPDNNLPAEFEPKITPLMSTRLGDINQRAEALAQVKQMHDDLLAAQAEIGQLKADLRREEDRCVMAIESRNKYRTDADLLRNQLMKICTTVANIGLLTEEAKAIVLTVDEHAAKEARNDDNA